MHVQRAAEMMIINCYSEQVPYLSLQYGPRSFAAAGPSTWNSLPTLLHRCHLTSSFHRDLKQNCLSERITSTIMTVSSCKAYDTSESFLSKVTFESHFRNKTCRCGVHTCASFYLRKSTFRNRTRSWKFSSQTVSCNWPVRIYIHNTQYRPWNSSFILQLLLFNLQLCRVELLQVTGASFLTKVSCASDFRKQLSVMCHILKSRRT